MINRFYWNFLVNFFKFIGLLIIIHEYNKDKQVRLKFFKPSRAPREKMYHNHMKNQPEKKTCRKSNFEI